MNQKTILKNFDKLPPEAQKQVVDFIAFLETRYYPARSRKITKSAKPKLAKESFVGIWRNRSDLTDSVRWVRNLRDKEWN